MKKTRAELVRVLLKRGEAPSQIVTQLQIRNALKDCQSVLDVGCGSDSCLSLFGFENLVGIEGYEPSVATAKKNHTHHQLVLGDVRDLNKHFQPEQFDACVALDLIEHLPKEDGLKLASAMERLARKKVLFLTPKGFLPQRHAEKSDLQEHLSGWEPGEMRRLGYHVAGVLGPKFLRGEYHKLKFRPSAFWGIVSLIGHLLFTRWVPSKSAAILCVKSK
jgi:SAM-dependent methyltransferase